MRNGFLTALLAVISLTGWAIAQPPASGDSSPPEAAPPPHLDLLKPAPPPTQAPSGSSSCGPAASCCPELCDTPRRPVCGPPGRVWAGAEYLLWWFEGSRVPPLVTASPPASSGVLGAPGTVILFGDSRLEEDAHSGGRFTLGYWLNDCQTIGVEGSYFFLGSRSTEFTAGGNGLPGSPVIARPIINAITGTETSELVSFPGLESGVVHVASSSRLEGAGINLVANLCCDCCWRVDLLGGFRYLQLREGLGIMENVAVNPGVPTIGGSALAVADQFDTRNQFYGGQLGARAEYRRGRMFVDVAGNIALGTTHEEIAIQGTTVITPAGGTPTTVAGGLLALPTNSGHFSRDRFAVVPEIGINVGYQVTDYLRAFMGYTFLYWSNVTRPGDAIDRTVNLTQLPSNLGPGNLTGPARPLVIQKDTEFWAQGLNFGLELRY